MGRRIGFLLLAILISSQELPAQEAPKKDPVAFSGGIYLFEYLPTLAGAKDKFEIYAFILNVDARSDDGRYGLHVQGRARDSKLRSFFLSNIWFQEAYAYAKTPFGDAHAGKFYRKVGILWDDSFFGNVQYFNGLKLNPDYGAEFVGSRPFGPWRVDYSAQYLNNNDHVAGSLPGRDVESDPDARLSGTWTARVAPAWKLSKDSSVGFGVSGLTGRIDRTTGQDFRMTQVAGDVTANWLQSVSYIELLHQNGEAFDSRHPNGRLGYDNATYLLAGTRWQVLPRANARINYSRVKYRGHDETETEVVPGVVWSLRKNVSVITEYDWWRTRPRTGSASYIDKSLNFVVYYGF